MTAKILQQNGEAVYLSTYHPLTVEERADPSVQQSMITFNETTEERLGTSLPVPNLKKLVFLIPLSIYLMLMRTRTR